MVAGTLLNEEKRKELFAWLTKHGVEIDPLFEEKMRELEKQKALEQYSEKLPKVTAEVEGYEDVSADLTGAGRSWIKGEEPPMNYEFYIDAHGVLHRKGEEQ